MRPSLAHQKKVCLRKYYYIPYDHIYTKDVILASTVRFGKHPDRLAQCVIGVRETIQLHTLSIERIVNDDSVIYYFPICTDEEKGNTFA